MNHEIENNVSGSINGTANATVSGAGAGDAGGSGGGDSGRVSGGSAGVGAAGSSTNGSRFVPGLLLVGLGVLVLLTNLGMSLVGNLLTAAIFGGLAYYVYRRGTRTGSQGLRLLAIPLAGLALVTLLPGRGTGALFLALIGLAFVVVWRNNQKNWWAVIPAGAFGSLAATAALSGLPGNFAGFVFLAGLAATFYALTQLRAEPQRWAIYPAGALAAVALLALFAGGGSWLFPLLLVGIGLVLLARSGAIEAGWLTDLLPRRSAEATASGPDTASGELVTTTAQAPAATDSELAADPAQAGAAGDLAADYTPYGDHPNTGGSTDPGHGDEDANGGPTA